MIKLSCNKLLRNVVGLNFDEVTRTKKGNYKVNVIKKVNPIVINLVEIELNKQLKYILNNYFNASNFNIKIVYDDSHRQYYINIELKYIDISNYSNKQIGEYFIVNTNDLQFLTSKLYKELENVLAYNSSNKLYLEY